MLIRDIRDFLEVITTQNHQHPIAGDKEQFTAISHHFVIRPNGMELNKEDYTFLLNCFKARWNTLSEGDYWSDSYEKANDAWTNLAKNLAQVVGKSYIEILFPITGTTRDFNNNELLAETKDPKHLYLNHSDNILYTREGLTQHLLNNDFQLSTYRCSKTKKMMPLSIDELTQLKKTKYTSEPVTVVTEEFANFWTFLSKKVLVRLNPENCKLPVELLAHLLQLIEHYFDAKKHAEEKKKEDQQQAYELFKEKMNQFYSLLMTLEFDIVNSFYGYIIKSDNKSYYILDYLIHMHRAQEFVLDESLRALANAITGIHSGFYSMQQKYMPFYTQSLQHSTTDQPIVPSRAVYDLEKCKLMLLSLLLIKKTGPKHISVWDHSNFVFAEAAVFFARFRPLIDNNCDEELVTQYKTVYHDKILSYSPSTLFLSSLFGNNALTDKWYEHAKNETFNQLGIYWYEPELLMHALLRFKTTRTQLINEIETFLDDILSTYAQSNAFSVLQKEFRVNILFHSFFSKLEQQDKHNLMTVLQIYPLSEAKEFFLANSTHHLMNRCNDLSTREPKVSMRFVTAMIDTAKQGIIDMKINSVSALIKTYIDLYKKKDDISNREELFNYLNKHEKLIKTYEQWSKIHASAQGSYFHGDSR